VIPNSERVADRKYGFESRWGSTASGQPASFGGAGQSRDGFFSLSRFDSPVKRDVGISPIGIAIAAK